MTARLAIPTPSALGFRPTSDVAPALPGFSSDALAASFLACATVTQQRARNFFYGLRLTPEPRRSAIYAIYTWMREGDDLADEAAPIAERRARLAEHRTRTRMAIDQQHVESTWPAWWAAFAATMASYPIDPIICEDMLAGLDADLDNPTFATDEHLSQYCYRVAGTAGLACLWIWGLRAGADPDRARDLALRRGQAFQRTNILRDFAEDFDEVPSRVYFPTSTLVQHGLVAADIRKWSKPDSCHAAIAQQAAIAREHYTASAELESMIDPACSPTLWAMTRIYAGLLSLIENDPARVVGERRIRLAGPHKASIAIRAAIKARMGSW